tara:strand:- start:54 stop:1688 length:1635 start_codon:yes stop_codon:yes gene_type:complete
MTNQKVSFEEFEKRVKKKFGNKFSFCRKNFVSLKHPMTIFCETHKKHIEIYAASHVTYHNPCKQCVRDERFKVYVQKVLSAMKENYPKLKLMGEILDFNGDVTIRCPKHGEFQAKTDAIIFKRMGCWKCGREATGAKNKGTKRVSFEEYKKRFVKRHGSKLTLISDETDYQNRHSVLTAKCSDPSHPPFQNTFHNFLRYNGCKQCNESMGERLVRLALEDLQINFEKEKRFSSCRDKKELPFDFWLPDFSTLIEFQGKQHEVPAERFGGRKALAGVQRRDFIKKEWAEENGINLIILEEYVDLKGQILKQLKPQKSFNPKKVLAQVRATEERWAQNKWDGYLKRLNDKHKGKYDFSASSWKWGQRDIEYICPQHGKRVGELWNLMRGKGCNACAGKEVSLDQIIKRSVERFGDQFDFSKSIFQGMEKEMEIICKTHGSKWITPANHFWLSKGCRECGGKAENFSPVSFLKKAERKFGDRFDYSNLGYVSTTEKVTIKCKTHNLIFQTRPNDHIRADPGCCPDCVKEKKSKTHSKSQLEERKVAA